MVAKFILLLVFALKGKDGAIDPSIVDSIEHPAYFRPNAGPAWATERLRLVAIIRDDENASQAKVRPQ
jgi:hypothetical protein